QNRGRCQLLSNHGLQAREHVGPCHSRHRQVLGNQAEAHDGRQTSPLESCVLRQYRYGRTQTIGGNKHWVLLASFKVAIGFQGPKLNRSSRTFNTQSWMIATVATTITEATKFAR